MPVPLPSQKEPGKWKIVMRIMSPWQYDVIEDPNDLTEPMVYILSDFVEQRQRFQDADGDLQAGIEGRRTSAGGKVINKADGKDQKIADDRADKGTGKHREFIWWSDKYHFTTDEKGTIVKIPNKDETIFKDKVKNPIGIMPAVNIAEDQDGFFWAIGGEDVVEGSLLINKQITDINFVTFLQSWGQLVVTARDVPKLLEGGPDRVWIFEVKDDDPQPQVFYASSNPPVADWWDGLKSYVAFLLTTNNLSPRNLSASLEANNTASGIAMIIESSESNQDVQETQSLYQDKEPEIWERIRLWHGVFHKAQKLVKDQQAIPVFTDSNVILKFNEVKPAISEKEKLENMEKRKALGLNTMIELLQKDNPGLSDEDAKVKAAEIMAEKKERQDQLMSDGLKKQIGDSTNEIKKIELENQLKPNKKPPVIEGKENKNDKK